MRNPRMMPISLHRKGTVSSPEDKGSSIRPAIDAARGGASNTMQDYAKATPMANPQPPTDDF